MLSRVLEPEVMDSPDEARDYDAMDHRDVNRRFVDDLLLNLPNRYAGGPTRIEILDLGAGTAQIPIELCRRDARANVFAVDAALHMLDLARRNTAAAGFADRIELQSADAKRLNYADGRFDTIMSNSIVHHLAEPISCLAEAVRVTRPGGLLFFRDLLRPDSENSLDRLVDQYAPPAGISKAADHQRSMFAASLHAALSLAEVQALAAKVGFAAETVRATGDRHWTWCAKK